MKAMKPVDDHGNGLVIKGYVGIGENARGNRNQELFFINGRVMHSRILNEAVETACRERVMIGKFPVCALYITIAYEAVDVNVHPNKLEVRFADETGVYEAVLSAVLRALKEKDVFEHPEELPLTPKQETNPETAKVRRSVSEPDAVVSVSKVLPAEAVSQAYEPIQRPQPEYRDARIPGPVKPDLPAVQVPGRTKTPVSENPEVPLSENKAVSPAPVMHETAEQINTILPAVQKPMKVFGALFNTFILIEYEDQLLLVDQHAVHERLLFDRLMKEHSDTRQPGQELLVPIVISVTNAEQRLLEENRDALESIGMTAEAFGERDVAVRTIPMILGEAQTADFVRDVISELQKGHDPTFEKRRTILLQTACKHAVKGGDALSEDQLRNLLDRMISQNVTPTCPHGRPLVVSITHRELDKKFRRIQK